MGLKAIKYIDRHIGIMMCNLFGFFSGNKIPKDYSPKKILMIKFSGFGNIVMALPTIRAIRKKYPNAEITFLTHSINKTIIQNDPSINEVICFDIVNIFKTVISIPSFFSEIKKKQFDMAIDFEQFSRFSALISLLSGAKIRIGFDTLGQKREKLFNIQVKYNDNNHTSKTFGDIGKALKVKIDFNDRKIFLETKDKEKIDSLLKSENINKIDTLVGIHPGCGLNNPKRKWEKEKIAELADFLIDKYGVKIFFTGSSREKSLIKKIQELMNHESADFSDKVDLKELAELISRCKAFVSSDTGPLHLASAMEIPVISFFGPNTPLLYGPLGKNNLIFYKKMPCSPCTTNFNEKTSTCKHFVCIKNITVKEVKETILNSNILTKK